MKNVKELLAENKPWAEEMFVKIDKKMSVVTIRSRDKLADGVDKNGVHLDRMQIAPNEWTNGFWGGLNCMLYNYTKNEEYLKTAKRSDEILTGPLANYEKLNHDVGFIYHILSGALYRITGDEDAKRRNLFAASSLASRINIDGGYMRAWNTTSYGEAVTIVDTMMNLSLLYWASDVLRDDRFKRIAMAHADMTLRTHFRGDGSVYHVVLHDKETGDRVKAFPGTGISVDSAWSRGHAWVIYGFMISYLHTKEERYLNASKNVANFFIANCCDDWLPKSDFRAPREPVIYDATAGACAACGMIELAKALPEDEGGMYMYAAINILKAMGEKFMNFDPATDDMLGFCTKHYPSPSKDPAKCDIHTSIIYGDYYYTEAILKLLGSDFNPWVI